MERSNEQPITNNGDEHRFEFPVGDDIAVANYRLQPGVLVLTHTEVPEEFEGKGIGSALARAAIEFARKEGLKISPLCPFMSGYIERHPEHHDLRVA